MTLEDELSEISQSQKDKYCMILLILGTQTSQIHRDRKQLLEARVREKWRVLFNVQRLVRDVQRKSSGDEGGDGCTTI